jgi:AraC-like DNA-binding protein
VPLPEKTVRDLLAVPISGRGGMGGAFTRWLTDLIAHADEFAPPDVPTLGQVTMDLLASFLGHCLDAEDAISPEARRRALQARIHDFIQQRLADPGLTPETIAAAHGISTRHLYKLFEEQGLTVAAWIRERRLERCRHDLTDPRLLSRPVQGVAARWGFSDPAHFSRLFRAAYGVSPRSYRHDALRHRMHESASSAQK